MLFNTQKNKIPEWMCNFLHEPLCILDYVAFNQGFFLFRVK